MSSLATKTMHCTIANHRFLTLAILFCLLFINLTHQLVVGDDGEETDPEDTEKILERALVLLKQEKRMKQPSRRPADDPARRLLESIQLSASQNNSTAKRPASDPPDVGRDDSTGGSEPEEYSIVKRVVATKTAEEVIQMLDRDLPDSVILKVYPWFRRQYADKMRKFLAENEIKPDKIEIIDKTINDRDKIIKVRGFKPQTGAASGADHFSPGRDESVIKNNKPKLEYPEAVTSLEFTDVTDKSLRVLWKPPNRTHGVLDFYTLEYSESSVPDKRISQRIRASLNEAKITDLTPQTSYTVEVFAHTNAGLRGPGKAGEVRTRVTPVLPEPPTNLVASNIGPHAALINFKPGFDGNANIDRWIVEALSPMRDDYTPTWTNIYTSTNHTQNSSSVLVRNLRPFTKYKIRLRPVNVVGQSAEPSSPSTEFQTAQAAPEQAPKDLLFEELEANSAVAHWTPLANSQWLGNPLGYNLTWTEVNPSSDPVITHHQLINDSRASDCQVRDLEEFTEYSFRIYAVNEAGSSPASEPVTITTLEDVPSSGPINLTAHALSSSSVQVEWNNIPKRHRNGIIRGYRIQYQAPDSPLQHKSVEENNTRQVTLKDLKAFTTYRLAVAGYTSMGDGVYSTVLNVQTLEDTPGKPQNLSSPSVTKTSAQVLWDPPEDPNGDILGYKVSFNALIDGSKEIASHELLPNETNFRASNLKPDTHYVFTVTAKTKGGWGQQASILLYTFDSEFLASRTFYRESWFVILCASSSALITIIITILLFIQTKGHSARSNKQSAAKSTSQDRLGDAGFSIDDEIGHYNNGFGAGAGMLSHTAGASHHRRSNGAISQSTANFTLPKTPPHPAGGSVVYSDDGDDDVFEDIVGKQQHHRHQAKSSVAGTSNYDDDDSSGDSLTEKPSEISSSTAEESEWPDDEYVNMANQRQAANHYANVNGGTLRSQRSWKKNGTIKSTYSSHRTKPKLPQRAAPSVPKVPGGEPSSSSNSDITGGQPMPGTSGMQQQQQQGNSSSIYGESQTSGSRAQSQYSTGQDSVDSGPKQNTQQQDLLDGHMGNLNGGRIIVNNMAGSRAPLPGFTSFV